jgi:orotate phosphoribosyltransferase
MPAIISAHAADVAHELLRLEAVAFNVEKPFTWASGLKSPIYCDNRLVLTDLEARATILAAFVGFIRSQYPTVEVIGGVATGGIPMGAWVAHVLNLPFIYVRSEAKAHGLGKQVEGGFRKGDRVVLIEDLISTGGSSMKAVNGIRNEGLELLGLVSIMTYRFQKADALFAENQVEQSSLCDLDTILTVAKEEGTISPERADSIRAFRDNPEAWQVGK